MKRFKSLITLFQEVIPMRKNIYRSKNVKDINVKRLGERVENEQIVFGVDVAKEDMYAVFMDETREVIVTVKWKHPKESHLLLEILQSLPCSRLEAAMEASGTYGDSLRYQLMQAGIPVFRVSTKKSYDYSEVYDGVPSSHDAKSSAIVARLHLDGMSDLWVDQSEAKKELRAAIAVMDLHNDSYYRQLNHLEALLARHWPEVTSHLDLTTASLLELLMEFGSPQEVAAAPDHARNLLRRVGNHFLEQAKIEGVISSAETTLGVPPIEEERQLIIQLARETRRADTKAKKAKKKVDHLSQGHAPVREMSSAVGKVTAAVIVATMGDPSDYSCASAWVKGMGLNLKERSSGKHKGQLKITKRGPSITRRYLYLAVLRIMQENEYFKKWYERKVKRDGGKRKGRGVVALMRKLAKALWYVGQGNHFDPELLFDTTRLKLSETAEIYD
jgi:transposase